MTKIQSIKENILEDYNLQHTLFRSFVVSFTVLSIVYIYLISSITFNVLARKSLDTTVRSLENNINTLELSYLDDLNKINKDYALSKGFVEVPQTIFATRESAPSVAIR